MAARNRSTIQQYMNLVDGEAVINSEKELMEGAEIKTNRWNSEPLGEGEMKT